MNIFQKDYDNWWVGGEELNHVIKKILETLNNDL